MQTNIFLEYSKRFQGTWHYTSKTRFPGRLWNNETTEISHETLVVSEKIAAMESVPLMQNPTTIKSTHRKFQILSPQSSGAL